VLKRADEEEVNVNFIVGDVICLELLRSEAYELAVDIGCLQTITDEVC